jgi:RHS repeat-associated protein
MVSLKLKKYGTRICYATSETLAVPVDVTNANGNVIARQNFDAWGRRRKVQDYSYLPQNTSSTDNGLNNSGTLPKWLYRGYTGHEMLDEFALINMNARLYDPVVGMFLSPDNYIQAPGNTQNYNRYAYCLNNPLKYTDPSGNLILAALFLTETGYEVQKYISPVALHGDVKIGSHQNGIGYDISIGSPKVFAISYRKNIGQTYYFSNYAGHKGWENRNGGEVTIYGIVNYSGTSFTSKNLNREQTTNMITVGIPNLNVKYENDTYLGYYELPGVPTGNPQSDAYKTAAARIRVGEFSIGMVLHTGEGEVIRYFDTDGDGVKETRAFDEGNIHDPSLSHGVFYFGSGPIKIGSDSEEIRHHFQNEVAHDGFNNCNLGSEYPYVLKTNRKQKFYFQISSSNGNTLY